MHYCVTNMPGAVARTSTVALNNATLPFVQAIAGRGWQRALATDPHLSNGLNICRGRVTHAAVADGLGLPFTPPEQRCWIEARPVAASFGNSAMDCAPHAPDAKPNELERGDGAPSDDRTERNQRAARHAGRRRARERQPNRRRGDCRGNRSLPRNPAGRRGDPRPDVGMGQPSAARNSLSRVVGVGLDPRELAENPFLDEWRVQD